MTLYFVDNPDYTLMVKIYKLIVPQNSNDWISDALSSDELSTMFG